jgi:ATP-dependent Zn protease
MMVEHKPRPRKRIKSALAATAYHEAGHAVVGLRLRVRIKTATIVPGGDRLGEVTHGKETYLYDNLRYRADSVRTRGRGEAEIIFCLSGLAAERRFRPRASSKGALGDHEHAADLALLLNSDEVETTNAHIKYLSLRTDKLVADNWPQVEAVAQALLERRTLKVAEIAAIVREKDHALASPVCEPSSSSGVTNRR